MPGDQISLLPDDGHVHRFFFSSRLDLNAHLNPCFPLSPHVSTRRAPANCGAYLSNPTARKSLLMSGLACASDGRDGGPRFISPPPPRTCVPGLTRHATGPRWAITCALWMCLDGEAKPQRDCNALSAGFLPARHGLHMGCQCESDSLSYAASPLQPRANFSTWPCHARFSLALFVCVCVSLVHSRPICPLSPRSLPPNPPATHPLLS